MKPMPVCIDTQICVWGIKTQAKPGQKNEPQMIARAQQLFFDLSKDKISVCIPSIVLAELLVHEVGSPNAEKLRAEITAKFNILVFNTMCAKRHAEMVAMSLSDDEKQKIKNLDTAMTKAKLRADLQIVSTMLGNGIKVLYTEDPTLTYVGRTAGLTVMGLPGLQTTVFDIVNENGLATIQAPSAVP